MVGTIATVGRRASPLELLAASYRCCNGRRRGRRAGWGPTLPPCPATETRSEGLLSGRFPRGAGLFHRWTAQRSSQTGHDMGGRVVALQLSGRSRAGSERRRRRPRSGPPRGWVGGHGRSSRDLVTKDERLGRRQRKPLERPQGAGRDAERAPALARYVRVGAWVSMQRDSARAPSISSRGSSAAGAWRSARGWRARARGGPP